MSTKIIYLSTFLPRDKKNYYASKMHNYNFNSADAFSFSVFSGLSKITDINLSVVNVPPLGAFPRFNSLFYSSACYEKVQEINIHSIANCNLIAYQYYSVYRNTLKTLKNVVNASDENCFVVYSINVPVLKAVINYRKNYAPRSKIVLIIPDLIEDTMADTFNTKVKKMLFGNIENFYKEMNGFVFLTEQMNERVKTEKPYCIVEGIYNSSEDRKIIAKNDEVKTIFYSGMLYEKFGVKKLLDAFRSLKNPNYRLQICGCGELEECIRESALIDKRIQFLGLIDRKKALELQSMASLLVNPRTPEGDFTKYSFPSKDIEYLVSGTPTLIYQLPGIPTEYYDYCYSLGPNELSVEDLGEKINEILSLPDSINEALGQSARNFIIEKKNDKVQAKKIIKLISKL